LASTKNGNKLAKKTQRDYEAAWQAEPSRKMALITLLKNELRLEPKNDNQRLFLEALADKRKTFVIGSGAPGTGKTFMALASALNLLRDGGNDFEEIIIFKSVKMLEGEDIGYLPGDKDDKLQYIYLSYFNQLEKLVSLETLAELKEKQFIKVLPIGAIRGLSIGPKSIVIVDEMQNLSVDNTHAVITRMESKAKMICLGDVFQRDHRDKQDNGLVYLTENMRGLSPCIEVVEFTADDSVRSKLIKLFQEVYEAHLAKKEAAQRESYEARRSTTLTSEQKTPGKGLLSFLK
jgi:predicted ribonuclease YlaK